MEILVVEAEAYAIMLLSVFDYYNEPLLIGKNVCSKRISFWIKLKGKEMKL